jgi:hypothetical protein
MPATAGDRKEPCPLYMGSTREASGLLEADISLADGVRQIRRE